MLHEEGGASNFCFSAMMNAGACGKVIRSSREAGKEYKSHLICRCATSPHLPFLQSAFPPVQPGYILWDTLTSLWGIFLYSATCPEGKHHLPLGTSELFPFFLCFLCPFTFNPDSCCCLSPYSILSPVCGGIHCSGWTQLADCTPYCWDKSQRPEKLSFVADQVVGKILSPLGSVSDFIFAAQPKK